MLFLCSLVRECEEVLQYLDRTQVDSKFNVLLNLIDERKLNNSRTWVYSSYLTTITFLNSSLSEKYKNIYQVSSQLEFQKRNRTLERFNSSGGTLIASAHFLKGLELTLDNIILYDIPESKELMYLILTRARNDNTQSNINAKLNIFVLNDVSKVSLSEQKRMRSFQKFVEELALEEQ